MTNDKEILDNGFNKVNNHTKTIMRISNDQQPIKYELKQNILDIMNDL
jgi:hypothetical protein